MNDKKVLLGNGMIYLVSTVLIKGMVFITMPVFTRILSVEDFGIYNAYMSYEAVVSIIMTLGAAVVVRNGWIDYRDNFETFEKSMAHVLMMVFGGTVSLCLLVETVSGGLLARTLGLSELLFICLLFHSSGYGLVLVASEKYRMEYKAKKVMALSLIITLSNVIISLFIIHYQSGDRYLGRIIGAASPYLVFWLFYVVNFFRNKSRIDKTIFKYVLALGLPAVPYILSENIMLQSDRVMIERFIGAYEAGIYSAISTIASILLIVGSSIESVWAPWSYKKISEGQHENLKKATIYYCIVFAFMSVGFATISPELIRIFTSKQDYWDYTFLIYPMVLMQFTYFVNKIPSNLLFYYKKTVYCSAGICVAAVINIVFNYIAFLEWGFEIAAITSLFSVILLAVFQYILCKVLMIDLYMLRPILLIYVLTVAVILTEYWFMPVIWIRYLIGIIAVVAAVAAVLLKMKEAA